jgi:ribosomal protein L37AE/L43A
MIIEECQNCHKKGIRRTVYDLRWMCRYCHKKYGDYDKEDLEVKNGDMQ